MESRYDENGIDKRSIQEEEAAYQLGLIQEQERLKKEEERKAAEAEEQAQLEETDS